MDTLMQILALVGLVVTLATPVAAAFEKMADGLLEYSLTTESQEDDKVARKVKEFAHGFSWLLLSVSDNLPVVSRRKSRQ